MAGGGSTNRRTFNQQVALPGQTPVRQPTQPTQQPQQAPSGFTQPQQTQRQLGTFDPYQDFSALGPIEGAVLGNLTPTAGTYESPYVAPGEQQQAALNQMQQYGEQASPLYGESIGQQRGTVGGQYLDPMNTPAFQRLASAREGIARNLFSEFAPQYRSADTARSGGYSSSAENAGIQRGGERLATQAAEDISRAGFGQYAAERGFQEGASGRGMELAPNLAGRVFTGYEQAVRGPQQAGNLAALQANLQARGYDQQAIQNALNYMRMRALDPVQPIIGETPEQALTRRIGTVGGLGIEAFKAAFPHGISNMNTEPTDIPEAPPPSDLPPDINPEDFPVGNVPY